MASTLPTRLSAPPSDVSPTADPIAELTSSADAALSDRTADAASSVAVATQTEPAAALPNKLVLAIQRELSQRGYDPGRQTGIPGILTRAAIMAFEADQHLPITGEPSEELLRQIVLGIAGSETSLKVVQGTHATRVTAGAQRLLAHLGYDPGPVNGMLGDATRKALRRFEGDAGFVPRGRISGEVIAELARRAGARIDVADEALSR